MSDDALKARIRVVLEQHMQKLGFSCYAKPTVMILRSNKDVLVAVVNCEIPVVEAERL